MLQVELGATSGQAEPLDRARLILDQLGQQAQNPCGWNVARHLEFNRALLFKGSGPEAQAKRRELDFKASVYAHKIIEALHNEEQPLSGKHRPYSFGENYSPVLMLVTAALTAGSYCLEHEADPEAALHYVEIGVATNYGFTELYELKVRALLQLGRDDEAIAEHFRHQCALEEVVQSPRYHAFVKAQQEAWASEEARKAAAVYWVVHEGTLAERSDIDELTARFGPLPESLSAWLGRENVAGLERVSEGYSTHYRRLDVPGMIEARQEMLQWVHLHDDSSPRLAAELHQYIREQGIDPEKMLPVVCEDEQPEFLLVRLDEPDRGAVYLWSHEESSNFDRVADSAQDIWDYLRS